MKLLGHLWHARGGRCVVTLGMKELSPGSRVPCVRSVVIGGEAVKFRQKWDDTPAPERKITPEMVQAELDRINGAMQRRYSTGAHPWD